MSLYARKLRRELWQQKGLALAVLAVTSLGVFLFITSAAGYLDLTTSYADTRARLSLAAVHADVRSLSEDQLDTIKRLPGVAIADARVVTSLPVIVPARPESRIELRLLSIPSSGQPALDRLLLLSGRLPAGRDQLLLEKHFAEHHHLHAGDVLRVLTTGGQRELTISGVAVSAEYLWVARDAEDVFPNPDAFGVGWLSREAQRELAAAVLQARPEAAAAGAGLSVAAGDAVGNQLLLQLQPGVTLESITGALKRVLGPGELLSAVREENIVGVHLLQMDVDGYQGMAGFFPFFFLAVGAFIVASVLGRLVASQRALIGTLLALGVSRARVLTHYLSFALALGATGGAFGVVAGVLSGRAVTQLYAGELGIPFVTSRIHWGHALAGFLGACGVACLAGLVPALRASRLAPAESMRPVMPSMGSLARWARRLPASLPVRLAIRDALGAPLRSVGTVFGVAAAIALVIVCGVLIDSMKQVVHVVFDEAEQYDLRVDLMAPQPLDSLTADLRAIPGVTIVEGVVAVPVRMSANGRDEEAALQGLADDSSLLRPLDVNGALVRPGPGTVVLPRHLAKSLGVEKGAPVEVRSSLSGASTTMTVSGFADGSLGTVASARRVDLQSAFAFQGAVTSAVLRVQRDQLPQARRQVNALAGVARVEDLVAMREQVGQVMGLGWAMLGTMLLFSVVLAAAILFNTATLNILERRRELATLSALGYSQFALAAMLTLEHGLLTVGGLVVGLPLSLWAAAKVLSLYSGALFVLPFVVSPSTLASTVGAVVLTLFLAQWPALRALGAESLGSAVRTRE